MDNLKNLLWMACFILGFSSCLWAITNPVEDKPPHRVTFLVKELV